MMGTAGGVDTGQAHGQGREPVDMYSGGEQFLVWDARHPLSGNRNLVTPDGEDVRKIEDVSLLATNIRWKELGQQENAHHSALPATSELVRREVLALTSLESQKA